jgi:hypothetical protein
MKIFLISLLLCIFLDLIKANSKNDSVLKNELTNSGNFYVFLLMMYALNKLFI